jgi:hypothetical protein
MSAMNGKSVGGVVADAMTKKPKTKTVNLGAKGSFTEHPGALHRALGVPTDKPIPKKDLEGHHSGRLGRMVASAKGFAAMKKG